MAADRYRFVRRLYDSYELDAIRAIQVKSHRTKMELSADYTDYADFVLQLGSCRATKENAIWPNSDFGSPAVCNQKK
jgi:hypothetical protein